jgi:cytochrome c biogenesis protein CcdA
VLAAAVAVSAALVLFLARFRDPVARAVAAAVFLMGFSVAGALLVRVGGGDAYWERSAPYVLLALPFLGLWAAGAVAVDRGLMRPRRWLLPLLVVLVLVVEGAYAWDHGLYGSPGAWGPLLLVAGSWPAAFGLVAVAALWNPTEAAPSRAGLAVAFALPAAYVGVGVACWSLVSLAGAAGGSPWSSGRAWASLPWLSALAFPVFVARSGAVSGARLGLLGAAGAAGVVPAALLFASSEAAAAFDDLLWAAVVAVASVAAARALMAAHAEEIGARLRSWAGAFDRVAGPVGLVLALALVAVLGYVASLVIITSEIPVALGALSVFAGFAAFFNPCALPVFPALVAHIYAARPAEGRTLGSVRFGMAGAAGLLVFMTLLGLAVATVGDFGLKTVMETVEFRTARIVFGGLMVVLGFLVVLGRGGMAFRFNPAWLGIGGSRPMWSMFAYGFVYTLLGLGCTAPILGGMTLAAFAAGGFELALAVFLLASLVMAATMVAMTVAVRRGRGVRARSMARLYKWAGPVVAAFGVFVILEALFPDLLWPVLHPWL